MSKNINVVDLAVSIIAGSGARRVERAAQIIGVSSPTLYRWMRAGNLRSARGAELLRIHDLSRIPMEVLLGSDGFSAGKLGWQIRRWYPEA